MSHVTDGRPEDRQIERIRAVARATTPMDFAREAPPPALWNRISQEVGAAATPLRPHSRRRTRLAVSAVAASVAAAVGAYAVVSDRSDTAVLAKSSLTNQGLSPRGAGTTGQATLQRRGNELTLDIDINRPPQLASAYLELWVIDRNVSGMASLGPFHGSGGYPIPTGIDPTKYPIVDISVEPPDGVPTHSGESIVRGTLS